MKQKPSDPPHRPAAFDELPPMERMETMHKRLCEMIALRAAGEGVTEHEIYQRYLRDRERDYERSRLGR